MLHQLYQLLPTSLVLALPIVLVWGNVVGILLWLLGGRFSRAMLTLLAVTAGSWVGVRLPQVFGWSIEPSCVGVCGAIVLGAAAYLFHRTLIGISLGGIGALWAIVAAWVRFDGPDQWHPADLHWTGSLVTWLAKIWQSFPGQLGMVLPYACGAGLAGGVLVAVLWPRLGRCLLYSLAGATLILATGIPLAARLRPDWLESAPASSQAQLLILLGVVAAGVAVQWCLTRQPAKFEPEAAVDVPDSSAKVASAKGASAQASLAARPRSPGRRETLAQCTPVVPVR